MLVIPCFWHISVRGGVDPGIKSNYKVTIFNSHLTLIYYMGVNHYNYIRLSEIEAIRCVIRRTL